MRGGGDPGGKEGGRVYSRECCVGELMHIYTQNMFGSSNRTFGHVSHTATMQTMH